MADILKQILDNKQHEITAAKKRLPLNQLKQLVAATPRPRNFFKAVTTPSNQLRVIAEVKKAGPSARIIRQDFDAIAIARAYYENGAAAISCRLKERGYIPVMRQRVQYLQKQIHPVD